MFCLLFLYDVDFREMGVCYWQWTWWMSTQHAISDISLHFQHYILYFILMSDFYQYHDSTFKHSEPICFMLSKNNGSTIIFKLDNYIVWCIHSFTGAYSPWRIFGLPFRGVLITHIQTYGKTPLDEWSARRRDLYLHRTTQQTNIHASSCIRTRDPGNQAAADLCLRPRGHWNRHIVWFQR
jgi:hypothetical protein